MTRVKVSAQVEAFVKSLAPAPRHGLRRAIKGLARDEGDRRYLEGELAGWQRLRVAGFRVIYKERFEKGARILDCVYANRRSMVYDLFSELLKHQLLSG
jgi:mRNA-degrading endonuclease RelE of RelBE toxin-antitoxin system